MVIKPTARQNPSRKQECQNGAFYFSRARFYVFFIIFYVTDFFFLMSKTEPAAAIFVFQNNKTAAICICQSVIRLLLSRTKFEAALQEGVKISVASQKPFR